MALTLALLEGGSFFVAVCAMIFLWTDPVSLERSDVLVVLRQAFGLALCCIIAFYYNDLYDFRIARTFAHFASRLLRALGVAFILVAIFYALVPDARIAGGLFISSFVIVIGLLLPLRALSYAILRSRLFMERVLILGTSELTVKLIQEIEAQPHCRYAVMGVVDDLNRHDEFPPSIPLRGPLEQLETIIEELRPHRIVVALAERRGQLPYRQLLEARVRGIPVEDGAEMYERLTGKLAIESLTPSYLTYSKDFKKARLELAASRALSLLFSVVALVTLAPLLALIALAIKLDSRGPLFIVQDRVGMRGKPFTLVKFRTMHPVANESSVWFQDNQSRDAPRPLSQGTRDLPADRQHGEQRHPAPADSRRLDAHGGADRLDRSGELPVGSVPLGRRQPVRQPHPRLRGAAHAKSQRPRPDPQPDPAAHPGARLHRARGDDQGGTPPRRRSGSQRGHYDLLPRRLPFARDHRRQLPVDNPTAPRTRLGVRRPRRRRPVPSAVARQVFLASGNDQRHRSRCDRLGPATVPATSDVGAVRAGSPHRRSRSGNGRPRHEPDVWLLAEHPQRVPPVRDRPRPPRAAPLSPAPSREHQKCPVRPAPLRQDPRVARSVSPRHRHPDEPARLCRLGVLLSGRVPLPLLLLRGAGRRREGRGRGRGARAAAGRGEIARAAREPPEVLDDLRRGRDGRSGDEPRRPARSLTVRRALRLLQPYGPFSPLARRARDPGDAVHDQAALRPSGAEGTVATGERNTPPPRRHRSQLQLLRQRLRDPCRPARPGARRRRVHPEHGRAVHAPSAAGAATRLPPGGLHPDERGCDPPVAHRRGLRRREDHRDPQRYRRGEPAAHAEWRAAIPAGVRPPGGRPDRRSAGAIESRQGHRVLPPGRRPRRPTLR